MRRLTIRQEQWPLHEPFVISRLVQQHAEVIVVEVAQDGHVGCGECERADAFFPDHPSVMAAIESVRGPMEAGIDRATLQSLLPSGNARNALDCALWDLEAKRSGQPVHRLAGLTEPLRPVTTVFTISLDTPEKMATAAAANRWRPVLKLKLGRDGDPDRVAAVRAAAPDARLTVDANTGWSPVQLDAYLPQLAALGVELVEQPFPPGADTMLQGFPRAVPLAADESCLDRRSLPQLAGKYDYVNVKLDKAGGLTEALALAAEAKAMGFGIMVGCNVGTSLAMAPGMVLAQLASFVDLDGPLLLARDREPGLRYDGSAIAPPEPALWG